MWKRVKEGCDDRRKNASGRALCIVVVVTEVTSCWVNACPSLFIPFELHHALVMHFKIERERSDVDGPSLFPHLLYFVLCCHPIRILLCISFLSESASRSFVLLENQTLLLFVVSLVVCLFLQVLSSSQLFFHSCIDWQSLQLNFALHQKLFCSPSSFFQHPLSCDVKSSCSDLLFCPMQTSDTRREGKKREERGWRTTDITWRKGMSEQKVERRCIESNTVKTSYRVTSVSLVSLSSSNVSPPPSTQLPLEKEWKRERERERERDWNQIESVCFHVRLESDLHPFYSCCFSLEASPCFVSDLLRQRHASLFSFSNSLSSPSDSWHDLHLILLSFFFKFFPLTKSEKRGNSVCLHDAYLHEKVVKTPVKEIERSFHSPPLFFFLPLDLTRYFTCSSILVYFIPGAKSPFKCRLQFIRFPSREFDPSFISIVFFCLPCNFYLETSILCSSESEKTPEATGLLVYSCPLNDQEILFISSVMMLWYNLLPVSLSSFVDLY